MPIRVEFPEEGFNTSKSGNIEIVEKINFFVNFPVFGLTLSCKADIKRMRICGSLFLHAQKDER